MFYIKKGNILGHWISTIYRIPYGLVWPDENSNGENLGKIVMGYLKPSLLSRLFAQRIYRPRYYHLFDSWETKSLPPIPQDKIKTVPGSIAPDRWLLAYWNKTRILLRWGERKPHAGGWVRMAVWLPFGGFLSSDVRHEFFQ